MFEFYERILSKWRLNAVKEEFNELRFIPDPDDLIGLTNLSDFILGTSRIESIKVLASIEKIIDAQTTEEAQKLRLKKFIGEFDRYIKRLNEDDFFKGEYSYFQTDLATKKNEIEDKYSFLKNDTAETTNSSKELPHKNKIQWVGNINLLTTLFYDLLNGQVKGTGKNKITTPPLIKAQKKDIAKLLAENFIDVNAEPLKESTLSDYLSKSENKSSSKLQEGYRIELPDKI